MWVFTYLYTRSGEPSVESKGDAPDWFAGEGFLIRCDTLGKYLLFQDIDDAIAYATSSPDPRFHEVIRGDRPQRLKFDLDFKAEDIAELPDELFEALSEDIAGGERDKAQILCAWFAATIADTLRQLNAPNLDLAIYETTDIGPRDTWAKYSYHILPRLAVTSSGAAQFVTNLVLRSVPVVLRRLLDAGVNKSVQNFRMCGSSKDGRRVKSLNGDPSLHRESLISYVSDCDILPVHGVKRAGGVPGSTTPINTDAILAICQSAGIMDSHKFRRASGNMLHFWRTRASYCEVCKREHTSDNTLTVHVSGRTVYYGCRREPGVSIPIGTLDPEPGAAIAAAIRLSSARTAVGDIEASMFAGRECRYASPQLDDFQLEHTLLVKAGMKMGKTKKLVEYVATHFANARVCIVSFRQTFSANVLEKFPSFTSYAAVSGTIRADRVICQVESLWRLDTSEPYDLVVCDECEAIFEQLDSGLMRANFNRTFAVFKWLMSQSRYMIAMDAFLGMRSINIIECLRYGDGQSYDRPFLHQNLYATAAGDCYKFTSDRVDWYERINISLRAGEKIALMANSLDAAKTAHEYIRGEWPSLHVLIYSSETLQSVKRQHFQDVNKYWATADVLIYTPTVTAGVSFEIEHYDRVFCYFTDQSCTTQTCIQMIGRVRSVRSREYVVCVAAQCNNLPTTYDEIHQWLSDSRAGIIEQSDDLDAAFEIGADREIKFYNTDYLHVWINNTCVRHTSRNSFTVTLMTQLQQSGARIDALESMAYNKAALMDQITAAREEHRGAAALAVAEAETITREEVDQITDLIAAGNDVSLEKLNARKRFWLAAEYEYDGPITQDYVEKYIGAEPRYWYRNLCALAGKPVQDALRDIRRAEIAQYTFIVGLESSAQSADIGRVYEYPRHKIALEWLAALGWSSLEDPMYRCEREIAHSVVSNIGMFRRDHRAACTEWGIPFNSGLFVAVCTKSVKFIIQFVNRILGKMYGVKIGTSGAMFKLSWNKLFCRAEQYKSRMPMVVPAEVLRERRRRANDWVPPSEDTENAVCVIDNSIAHIVDHIVSDTPVDCGDTKEDPSIDTAADMPNDQNFYVTTDEGDSIVVHW